MKITRYETETETKVNNEQVVYESTRYELIFEFDEMREGQLDMDQRTAYVMRDQLGHIESLGKIYKMFKNGTVVFEYSKSTYWTPEMIGKVDIFPGTILKTPLITAIYTVDCDNIFGVGQKKPYDGGDVIARFKRESVTVVHPRIQRDVNEAVKEWQSKWETTKKEGIDVREFLTRGVNNDIQKALGDFWFDYVALVRDAIATAKYNIW